MGLYRSLKRDIGGQIATSRNLQESRWVGCKRMALTVWFVLRAFLLGVRMMRSEQLGSHVVYQGRRCFVNNWAGSAYPTLADGKGFYRERVPRSEIRNVINLKELWHRFTFGVTFYTGSYLGIDVNRTLYPKAWAVSK